MRYSEAMAGNTREFLHTVPAAQKVRPGITVQENAFYQASFMASIFPPFNSLLLECSKK